MNDKELEEYINKIEPNFDSHLEKGTIEMSNEYYNLLEEKMARLINKNQELKNQLSSKTLHLENQQKEFIEYLMNLMNLSNWYSADGVRQVIANEILLKYKEIIGGKDA